MGPTKIQCHKVPTLIYIEILCSFLKRKIVGVVNYNDISLLRQISSPSKNPLEKFEYLRGIDFLSDNDVVVVDGFKKGCLYRISSRDHTITKIVTKLCIPNGISVDYHDNIFVGENGTGKLRKFDKNGKLLSTFPLTEKRMNSRITIGTNGDIFVADFEGDSVYIISGSSGEILRQIANVSHPFGIDVNPIDGTFIVNNGNPGESLGFYNPKNGQLVKTLTFVKATPIVLCKMFVVDGSGHVIVLNQVDGNLFVFDQDENVLKQISFTERIGCMAISSTGKLAFCSPSHIFLE